MPILTHAPECVNAACSCPDCSAARLALRLGMVDPAALVAELDEVAPGARVEAAALLNDGRSDFDFDGPTPLDALVEPNPRDEWPAWTDESVFELGPAYDRHVDDLFFERFGCDDPRACRLDDFDRCPGLIG